MFRNTPFLSEENVRIGPGGRVRIDVTWGVWEGAGRRRKEWGCGREEGVWEGVCVCGEVEGGGGSVARRFFMRTRCYHFVVL